MGDTEKSKNKRMAIKIIKYKGLRYFDRKVSFLYKNKSFKNELSKNVNKAERFVNELFTIKNDGAIIIIRKGRRQYGFFSRNI